MPTQRHDPSVFPGAIGVWYEELLQKKSISVSRGIARVLFVLFFVWISFFPSPIQEKCYGWNAVFLTVAFLPLLFKKTKILFKRTDVFLWLFLVSARISLSAAVDTTIAFRTFLSLGTSLFFIYYWVAEGFSSDEDFLSLKKAICVCSLVVAFWGILDSLLGVNILYETILQSPYYDRYKQQLFLRAIATQYHAPPLGTYLIASLPFNLMLINQERFFWKWLGVLGTILIIPAVILTCSRGVFLGLLAMIFCLFFLRKKKMWILLLFVGVAVFIFLSSHLFYPFTKLGVEGFFGPGDSLFSTYRFERIQMLGRILKDHPFWGLGFQNVKVLFHYYYPGRGIALREFMIMDNMYLTLAAEMGLVGFFIFLVFIISLLFKVWRVLVGREGMPDEKRDLQYVLAGFVGLLVNAAAYELFYWPNQYMFFCLYIGLIERSYRKSIFQGALFLKTNGV